MQRGGGTGGGTRQKRRRSSVKRREGKREVVGISRESKEDGGREVGTGISRRRVGA